MRPQAHANFLSSHKKRKKVTKRRFFKTHSVDHTKLSLGHINTGVKIDFSSLPEVRCLKLRRCNTQQQKKKKKNNQKLAWTTKAPYENSKNKARRCCLGRQTPRTVTKHQSGGLGGLVGQFGHTDLSPYLVNQRCWLEAAAALLLFCFTPTAPEYAAGRLCTNFPLLQNNQSEPLMNNSIFSHN